MYTETHPRKNHTIWITPANSSDVLVDSKSPIRLYPWPEFLNNRKDTAPQAVSEFNMLSKQSTPLLFYPNKAEAEELIASYILFSLQFPDFIKKYNF